MISRTRKATILFCWILFSPLAFGQSSTIVQKRISVSSGLTGHADFGAPDAPAKGVTVEICSPDWQTVLATTETDGNGYFSLRKPPTGSLFYLRLSAAGVNPYKLRVRIKETARRDLTIHLSLAT